mmetsp:Transcript_24842/g.32451  ORF Transcript_24842/g.32451 Transcript_24842/m.32451 type:complete len:428 (+) Transcript_24842:86-1369(+)
MRKHYAAKEYFKNLFTWHGTAFKAVLTRPDWVFFFLWALLLTLLRQYGAIPDISTIDVSGEVKIFNTITFVLTFLLVFFLKECYDRYRRQLRLVIAAGGKIKEIAMIAKVFFAANPKHAENLVRLLNAANHLFYYELSEIPYDMWGKNLVEKKKLLSKSEYETLRNYPGKCYCLCIEWVLDATQIYAKAAIEEQKLVEHSSLTGHSFEQLLRCLVKFRQAFSAIELDESFQTIPFPYYHFLCVVVYVYLFGLGFMANYNYSENMQVPVYLFIYLFTCIGILALFHLALEFADPFGTDDNDINLNGLLESILKGSQSLLWDETHHAWSDEAENKNFQFLPSYDDQKKDRSMAQQIAKQKEKNHFRALNFLNDDDDEIGEVGQAILGSQVSDMHEQSQDGVIPCVGSKEDSVGKIKGNSAMVAPAPNMV